MYAFESLSTRLGGLAADLSVDVELCFSIDATRERTLDGAGAGAGDLESIPKSGMIM